MLSKTLLALVILLGIAPCAYILTYSILYETYGYRVFAASRERLSLIANLATGTVIYVSWILLWRREVRWTGARRMKTLLALVVSMLPASMFYFGLSWWTDPQVIMFVAGLIWITLWLGSTTRIWRESPAEYAERTPGVTGFKLSCPKCGYEMTGLHQARCSEYGTQYTLDQLLASAQPDQAPSAERSAG